MNAAKLLAPLSPSTHSHGQLQPLWPGRHGKPDSAKRSPLPASLPKSSKSAASSDVAAIPAHIRAASHELSSDDQAYIRGKLGRALGKFAGDIVRVSVRAEDVNGPRGGVDKVCRIKVVLAGLPSVVFEKRDAALNAAVDGAVGGIEQAVRNTVRRRWTKPRRSRGRRSPSS